MRHKTIRKLLKFFKYTPLHPQWLVFGREKENFQEIAGVLHDVVLDIGCAGKELSSHLPAGCRYYGLDYTVTADGLYHSTPDIYGDAQELGIAGASVDCVVLLNVLEHLPGGGRCIGEISRVLRKDGVFVLSVPFLYPIHDAPFDFHRWTRFGLANLLKQHGFHIHEEKSFGQPSETAALLCNIALSKVTLNLLEKKKPLSLLLSLFAVPAIPLVNLVGWSLARIGPRDDFMPLGYRFVCSAKTGGPVRGTGSKMSRSSR